MRLDEIENEFDGKQEYSKQCICNETHKVRAQKDDYPEYRTNVYIECDCGDWVKFTLPVN